MELRYQLIASDAEFTQILPILLAEKVLAIDTEFVRRKTYYPILSLVQIATSKQAFVIDAINVDIRPLLSILLDNNITKVFHAAEQDLLIFFCKFKIVPHNVFDTQIAAKYCGYRESIGYANLCQQMYEVYINKSYQQADWLERPIASDLCEYAAQDVSYLYNLYFDLKDKIKDHKNYQAELEAKLLNINKYKVDLSNAWRRVRNNNKSQRFLHRLQMLASFREELAIKRNVPSRHYVDDPILIKLCHILPTQMRHISNIPLFKMSISEKQKLFDICAGLRLYDKNMKQESDSV